MDAIAVHFARYHRRPRIVLAVLLAGLLASLAPRSAAQPDTTRWTPELAMEYDQIAETEISPDGQHVAYVVREAVMDKTTSTFRQHIHIAAVDGSLDVQYTRGKHSNFSPGWSPSGDRLAFLSTRGGRPQVHVMRLRGGEAYAVTSAQTGVQGFQWGPEGERIAYRMTDPKPKTERQRERAKRDVNVVNEEFRYAHLYTTEVKPAGDTTRSIQRLTKGTFHVTGFDWAPDGSAIAFAHVPTPRANSFPKADLSTVPADSGAVETLVDQPGMDTSPRWSPDGSQVAFLSMGGEADLVERLDAYTVPAGGGTPTALPPTPNQWITELIGWTAGGESLLVADVAGTSQHIYALPTEGDSARPVTSEPGVTDAASYSHSADRLAVAYQNSRTPPEVFVGPRQSFTRRPLTAVNEEMPRPEMGRTERVTWTGPGGQEIEALLTYPVEYDGGRVPLVLFPHGGPADTHLRTFTGGWRIPYMAVFKPQVFAQRGYAMLRPNPRGSGGYGPAFRRAILQDWGGVDYEDLMAGVDKAIDMGVADPDSLIVAGGSYGGYMTAWTVTQTDRFEAASMVAGLSNLISVEGTTDAPIFLRAYMGGAFWEQLETYEASSPLYHVEGVETPTQILHGAEDERVPPSQGREFYRALRRQDVPTEMVLYPRMPHFPREPKQLVDMTSRMLGWFDEHLGRGPSDASDAASEEE